MLSALVIMPVILLLSVLAYGVLRLLGVRTEFEKVLTTVGIGVVFLPVAVCCIAVFAAVAMAVAMISVAVLPDALPTWIRIALGSATALGLIAVADVRQRIGKRRPGR